MSSLWSFGWDILRISGGILMTVAYIRYRRQTLGVASKWRYVTYVYDLILVAVPLHFLVEQVLFPYFSIEVDSLRRQFYRCIRRLREMQFPRIPFIVRLRVRQAYCCILIPCYFVLLYSSIYYSFYDLSMSLQLFGFFVPTSLYTNYFTLLAFQRIPERARVLVMSTGIVTTIVSIVRRVYYHDEQYIVTAIIGVSTAIIGYRIVLERVLDNRFQLLNGNAFEIRDEQVENDQAPAAVIQEAIEVNELPVEHGIREGIAVEAANNNELAEDMNFQQFLNVPEENLAQGENNMNVIAGGGNALPEDIRFEQLENVLEENLAQGENYFNDFVVIEAVDNQLADIIDTREVQYVSDENIARGEDMNVIEAVEESESANVQQF